MYNQQEPKNEACALSHSRLKSVTCPGNRTDHLLWSPRDFRLPLADRLQRKTLTHKEIHYQKSTDSMPST